MKIILSSKEEDKKESKYSEKRDQGTEYDLERLLGYLLAGIAFSFILLKIMSPY